MFVVGVTRTCKRLAFCSTQKAAEDYVGSLPEVESGIYYIDGPCDGPIVVAEVEHDDLP